MTDSINYRFVIETWIGDISLVFWENPFCLEKVILPSGSEEEEHKLIEKVIPQRNHPIRQISKLMREYFKGRSIQSPWKLMSMENFTMLQKRVLEKTASIPFGRTRSYGDIAYAIGRPRAYRFVGTTLANNPFPILIPCHRVIRNNHEIGEFGGGTDLKKQLIDFESRHSG